MKLTKKELQEAVELWQSNKPMKPIKEELGGDYYFRCGYALCNKVIKQEWMACPFCSTKIDWEED